ncbi:hypothetical protein IWQ60_006609 [Tieghemiomyces parasiticus]|uniref:Indigoidine synthase A like protein n=1 Tax=Tieghemiomyces parasiticus TaxID=78921 RepID=A0A9W8A6H6_9FUNG|nr:hypothetical protein IWQ60_006609 [Tieghemiomyces parasiticus]
MPYPDNLAVAQAVEAVVRDQGCTPATIALWDGKVQVGLDTARLEQLAQTGRTATKASRRDLAAVLSQRLPGATTVASTMLIAHRCGIPLFVTGGIGGVHRGAESTLDVSADLTELGRTPVAVVCSGTKSILDIPKTLEYLETQGVPVVTVGAGGPQFPAFFTPDSGHRSAWWVDGHHEAARFVHTQFHLSIDTGVVLAVPIPAGEAAQGDLIQAAIDQAIWEAS